METILWPYLSEGDVAGESSLHADIPPVGVAVGVTVGVAVGVTVTEEVGVAVKVGVGITMGLFEESPHPAIDNIAITHINNIKF